MSHKTLSGGTSYDIAGGRMMIDGTGYDIAKGRALVDGTGYDIPFFHKLTITSRGATGDKLNSWVEVDGEKIYSVGQYEVGHGEVITIRVYAIQQRDIVLTIKLNGDIVATKTISAAPYTDILSFEYTMTGDIDVALCYYQGDATDATVTITEV